MSLFKRTRKNEVLHLKLVNVLSSMRPGESVSWQELDPDLPKNPGRVQRVRQASKAAGVYLVPVKKRGAIVGWHRADPETHDLLVNADERAARLLNSSKRLSRECDVAAAHATANTPTSVHARLSYYQGTADFARSQLRVKPPEILGVGKPKMRIVKV